MSSKTSLQIYQSKDVVEAGVDEAGRGCLMGRVYAAAVIMPTEFENDTYLEIKDSKKLSAKKRERLAEYIKSVAISYGIGFASIEEIDKHNIFNANQMAMHRSLDNLDRAVDKILVDGNHFKPYFDRNQDFTNYECIVKGDNKFLSIASAGILAKYTRDEYIHDILIDEPEYEMYGWSNNKGYGTKEHIQSITDYGITKYHRKTFGICKTYNN